MNKKKKLKVRKDVLKRMSEADLKAIAAGGGCTRTLGTGPCPSSTGSCSTGSCY